MPTDYILICKLEVGDKILYAIGLNTTNSPESGVFSILKELFKEFGYVPKTKLVSRLAVDVVDTVKLIESELISYRHSYRMFGMGEVVKLYNINVKELMQIVNKYAPDLSNYKLESKLPEWAYLPSELEHLSNKCIVEDSDYWVFKVV